MIHTILKKTMAGWSSLGVNVKMQISNVVHFRHNFVFEEYGQKNLIKQDTIS